MLIYDCEIIRAIRKNDTDPKLDGIEYVTPTGQAAWRAFDEMGISVIGAYDYVEDRYRVFCADNFDEFETLVSERKWIVGFNSIAFDGELCRANQINIPVAKAYDLLVETWAAAGLAREFEYPSHAGYGLDAIGEANNLGRKSGHGALAPVDWQRGNIGAVVDYCLQDVRLTKCLLDRVLSGRYVLDPKTGAKLQLRHPDERL